MVRVVFKYWVGRTHVVYTFSLNFFDIKNAKEIYKKTRIKNETCLIMNCL
jgi:hypothetical protein